MFSLLLSLLAVSAFAEPAILGDSLIGQSTFRFSRPSTVRLQVQTCNSKGKVKAVQLHVKEGSLRLSSMDAFYSAGGRQRLASNIRLEKDQYGAWLLLNNQENPCLSRLDLNVGAGPAKTTVEVIGRWE